MKPTYCLTFWTLLLSLTTGKAQQSPETDTGPFTLEACLQYAYSHHWNLQNAAIDEQIARADVGITKADGLPQINGTVTYTNNVAIQTQFLPAIFVNPEAAPEDLVAVPFGVPHTANAGVTIRQMLFDGAFFVGLRAANVYSDLMHKEYEFTKTDIAEQVTKAYYTVLVNETRKNLLMSNYNRLDSLLQETTLMFENGFAEQIEVDRIRVQYNNAKTEKDNNDRLTDVSYYLLKFQMGMPVQQDIQLADNIEDITTTFDLLENLPFDYSHRVEYGRVMVNQELAQLDVRNNRRQFFPKLSANASFGANTGVNNFNDMFALGDFWFQYGFLGLTLEIPIFDGLNKYHTGQKNKLLLQKLQNESQKLKNDIDTQIIQARVELENNVESLNIQQENLELANSVYEVAKIKYQEGVGSNIEVITSQDDLQTAENNYFSALYDALIAKVDLDKALGRLLKD